MEAIVLAVIAAFVFKLFWNLFGFISLDIDAVKVTKHFLHYRVQEKYYSPPAVFFTRLGARFFLYTLHWRERRKQVKRKSIDGYDFMKGVK